MKAGNAKSVMIVEKDPASRALLNKILKSLDCYVVGESSGGQDALDLYEKRNPDIVLLDIQQPGKQGLEILKEIIKQNPSQIVIILTAESDQDTVLSCVAAGAKGYVLKSDSANAIQDRIKKFIP
ncbi:response regulator transcription factor [bacterium]|nr:response regulator transcription factor [bacterium]